jgi:hypothetical protein
MEDKMKGIKISESDRCHGCFLSPRWFVKIIDGYYRCPECKTLYNKVHNGIYKVVETK